MQDRTRATPLILAALVSVGIVACAPSHTAIAWPTIDPILDPGPRRVSDEEIRYPASALRPAAGKAPRGARTIAGTAARARVAPGAMANGVLAEVNRERRRKGARPLVMDARLNRAAERYARELAYRREIEHVSPTPGLRTFRQRMHAEGARARIAGENLARLTASPTSMPQRTLQAWLRSPGHRANLLDASWRRTGVGVWQGRDGVWYIVQLYATPD